MHVPKLIAFKSCGKCRSGLSLIAIAYLKLAYLDQYKGCVTHTQERERLRIPEALDDKGCLQEYVKQEHS